MLGVGGLVAALFFTSGKVVIEEAFSVLDCRVVDDVTFATILMERIDGNLKFKAVVEPYIFGLRCIDSLTSDK